MNLLFSIRMIDQSDNGDDDDYADDDKDKDGDDDEDGDEDGGGIRSWTVAVPIHQMLMTHHPTIVAKVFLPPETGFLRPNFPNIEEEFS